MWYLSNKLFSHPDKLLKDHLSTVGQTARNWTARLNLNLITDKSCLVDVACIIGLAHDLGKSTQAFQAYLKIQDQEEKTRMKNHVETRHSPLGAFCGYYLVSEYVRLRGITDKECDYLPIAAFLVIQRHHGDLNSLVEAGSKKSNGSDIIARYLDDVNRELWDELLADILTPVSDLEHCNYEWFKAKINHYDHDMRTLRVFARKIGRKQKLDYYFITGLLYSILVDVDKSDASGLNMEYINNLIPGTLVDEYQHILGYDQPDMDMDRLRHKIYREATNIHVPIEKGHHILSINVPTGTGKTMGVLSAAIKIREALYSQNQIDRSIVYALPFTSIIDQNYQVFNEIFTKVTGQEPGSNILLKHHYLADGLYKVEEYDDEYLEYSPLESRFIIEGWNSSIIVTTFVQLFHSLITNHNAASRKFHRIANSIIILDEVQAIPHQYWQLLRQICNYMAKYMDTYFILVTATLPLIFPPNEIHDLVANKEHYFCALNRIKLEACIDEVIDICEFQQILLKEALKEENKTKDILVVMNTIKSAQIIYEALLYALGQELNCFFYLSSHVVPAERKQRITKIKEKHAKRKVVVSTQLIEAGVDIDLDLVFRDMGPLDSINQVAGRCKRNQCQSNGVVRLYYIKRGKKPDSSYIYDSTLLNATQKTIAVCSNQGIIEESSFYTMSRSYYELLNQGILTDAESHDVLTAIFSLNYEKIKKFRLIDENYEKADLFVEIDETARELWHRFLHLREIEDRWQRKEEFYRFKNIFQQYIISVQKDANSLSPFSNHMVGGIYHISLDIMDMYYKSEGHGDTGFVTQGDAYAIW